MAGWSQINILNMIRLTMIGAFYFLADFDFHARINQVVPVDFQERIETNINMLKTVFAVEESFLVESSL